MNKMPSNSDLATLIDQNHKELKERLKGVEEQVIRTNGRLKDLERKEIGREAIEIYKSGQLNKRQFDVTTIISILVAIGTIVGALWWTVVHK
jgi:hypothetical protein